MLKRFTKSSFASCPLTDFANRVGYIVLHPLVNSCEKKTQNLELFFSKNKEYKF